jgi:uncharacterized protein (DUF111 family)
MAAYRYHSQLKGEWQKIRTIANNNKFPIHQIAKLRAQIQRKTQMNTTNNGNNNK